MIFYLHRGLFYSVIDCIYVQIDYVETRNVLLKLGGFMRLFSSINNYSANLSQ